MLQQPVMRVGLSLRVVREIDPTPVVICSMMLSRVQSTSSMNLRSSTPEGHSFAAIPDVEIRTETETRPEPK